MNPSTQHDPRRSPWSVHIECTASLIAYAQQGIDNAGGSTFLLDLTDAVTSVDLVSRFVEVFRIPWQINGIDSVISIASDLDWIESEPVYLTVVDNCDSLSHEALDDLAVALVDITDRMRSGNEPYTVMFTESLRTGELLELLTRQNQALASFESEIGDMHPVPIIDHRSDPPASAPSSRGCQDAP